MFQKDIDLHNIVNCCLFLRQHSIYSGQTCQGWVQQNLLQPHSWIEASFNSLSLSQIDPLACQCFAAFLSGTLLNKIPVFHCMKSCFCFLVFRNGEWTFMRSLLLWLVSPCLLLVLHFCSVNNSFFWISDGFLFCDDL